MFLADDDNIPLSLARIRAACIWYNAWTLRSVFSRRLKENKKKRERERTKRTGTNCFKRRALLDFDKVCYSSKWVFVLVSFTRLPTISLSSRNIPSPDITCALPCEKPCLSKMYFEMNIKFINSRSAIIFFIFFFRGIN